MIVRFIVFVYVISFTCNMLFAEKVKLRESNQIVECNILSGGIDGLHVVIEGDSNSGSHIPWSEIASLETESPRPSLDKFLKQGDTLWRAKLRFLRGDLQLAQPIFESLFHELIGSNGKDARLVSEGLMRCYVAKGELTKALHPWLETVRLHESGIESPYTNLNPILDSSTLLCRHLPPIWSHTEQVKQILESYKGTSQKLTSAIASILLEPNLEDSQLLLDGLEDASFLPQILACKSQNLETLRKTYKPSAPWKEIWLKYFRACELLNSSIPEDKVNAQLLLADVAASGKQTVPWLSGAAMLKLRKALEDSGYQDEAQRIMQEMLRVFPNHPLLKTENSN